MASNAADASRPIPISSIVRRKNTPGGDTSGIQKIDLRNTATRYAEQISTADGILQLFSDLRLAREIRTAMILSPKDMIFKEIRFSLKTKKFSSYKKIDELINDITVHLRDHTPFEKDIEKYIDDALFTYGAHVLLMVPPTALDRFIKGDTISLESADEYYHILDSESARRISNNTQKELSDYGVIGITDNVATIGLAEKLRDAAWVKNNEVALEGFSYENNQIEHLRKLEIPSDQRLTDDCPIIQNIPMAATIPICDPSDPSNHLDYLIVLDENGYPAKEPKNTNYFNELRNQLNAARGDSTLAQYQNMKRMGLLKDKSQESEMDLAAAMELYTRNMDGLIQKALKEGKYQNRTFKLEQFEPFYRLMFARAIEGKRTRLLYVPGYLVDYMAFDYDSSGFGFSLLEKTKLYSSLRAVILFSSLIRQIDDSIPRLDLELDIDEKDPDPNRTITALIAEYGRYIDRSIPLSDFNPVNLMDGLRRSGIRTIINGGSKYPNTKMKVNETQKTSSPVNTDLTDFVKKGQYAGLSVPPEYIDQALQGEFAINTITQNQLMCKRSMKDQRIFKNLFMRRCRKYILLSKLLYSKIEKVVGKNNVYDFLMDIELVLPQANDISYQQLAASYQTYSQFLDDAANAFISDAMMRGLLSEQMSQSGLDQMKEVLVSGLKREFLIRQNMLPELTRLLSEDPEDKESYGNRSAEAMEAIFAILKPILKKATVADVEMETAVTKAKTAATPKTDDTGSGGQSGSSTTTMPAWGS